MMRYVDTPFVKMLTGVHRCGKPAILNIMIKSFAPHALTYYGMAAS